MSHNRSTAVMQRRSEPHDSLDDFPTPPWATRALCEFIQRFDEDTGAMVVREPAANRGYMVRPLKEYFGAVRATDVHDYGMGWPIEDYLFPGNGERPVSWVITNPPFRLAEEFVDKALRTTREGVAVIVRSAFLEGIGRYARLFADRPPTDVLQFTERVIMHKGSVPDPNVAVLNEASGKREKPSSATAYSWLVWRHGASDGGVRLHWIPPCRARLERPGDYDIWPQGVGS